MFELILEFRLDTSNNGELIISYFDDSELALVCFGNYLYSLIFDIGSNVMFFTNR